MENKPEFRLVVMDRDACEKGRYYIIVAKPGGGFNGAKLEARYPYSGDWFEVPIVEPYVRKDV